MLHTASAASELHRSARPATRVDTICFGSIALKDCFWPVPAARSVAGPDGHDHDMNYLREIMLSLA